MFTRRKGTTVLGLACALAMLAGVSSARAGQRDQVEGQKVSVKKSSARAAVRPSTAATLQVDVALRQQAAPGSGRRTASGGGCGPDFIETAPLSTSGNTCGAVDDCDISGTDNEDHIYLVTLPNDGLWTFSLCGSSYDTKIAVGTTCCGTEVDENDDNFGACGAGNNSQLTADLAAGDYWVVVDGFGSNCGDYELNITKEAAPECNPDFTMTAPVSTSGTTCGAGDDCDVFFSDNEDHIYLVTLPNDGMWTFSLCGSSYDTKLIVGTTCCGEEVDRNDDNSAACGPFPDSLRSELSANLTAGDYWVVVDGFGSNCGDYTLNITKEAAPECNPDFVMDAPLNTSGNTCGAGDDCDLRDTEEHIYEITLPNDGLWTFSLCGSGYDTVLFLGDTCCGDEVDVNDDECSLQSEISANLTAGTYYLAVEGFSGCGDYTLDVSKAAGCVVDCELDKTPENEPDCGIPTDTVNGGCILDAPVFSPLSCGEAYCGTAQWDGTTRDTDWYEFVVPEGECLQSTLTVTAEFDVVAGLIEQIIPGAAGCGNTTGFIDPFALGGACETTPVDMGCLTPGTYYAFVGADFAGAPFGCGAQYNAELTCEPCPCPEPPANDDCTNREDITDGDTNFDTVGASTDGPDLAGSCDHGGPGDDIVHKDVWYNYTATCDGEVTVTTCEEDGGSATFDTRIAIYDGCTCPADASDAIGCNDDADSKCGGFPDFHSTATAPVANGNCYKIQVGGFSEAEEGTGVLHVECGEPEVCEPDFTMDAPLSTSGNTCGAGDDCGIFGSDNEDHIYLVTLPNDGLWTFSLCGSSFDTKIVVGTTCCGNEVDENDDNFGACGPGLNSQLSADLAAGDYWVVVDGFGSNCGDYTLNISKSAPLENDDCEGRLDVSDGSTDFDLTGATNSGPEEATCEFPFGDDDIHQDIWFNYDATCTGELFVDTCGAGSIDTRLAVYEGCDCPPGSPPSECNDDHGNSTEDDTGLECPGLFESSLSLPVKAGMCYKIRVGAFSDGTTPGPDVLNIFCEGVSDPTGACCSPPDCEILTEQACADGGGEYQGDGTECFSSTAETQMFEAGGLGLPVLDDAGPQTHTIIVEGDEVITDVDVDLQLDHTWVGDVFVMVEHNGVEVVLINQPGDAGNAPGSPFGCSANNYDIILDDDGDGGAIEKVCEENLSSPPNYMPNGSLSDFNGMSKGGAWTITVEDREPLGTDEGSLDGWSLHITGQGKVIPTCPEELEEQTLIIKQGSCPARVNPSSNGVIPMLLVGTEDFDVNEVDRSTLALQVCGGGPSVAPLEQHTAVKDLNHPHIDEVGCDGCACNEDQSSDGIDDLQMKFRTGTTLETLDIGIDDGPVTLELTGQLLDGSSFTARDCVQVVPPSSGETSLTFTSNVIDTFIEITPLDANIDSDGFSDFGRAYFAGTNLTVTAPVTSDGRKFVRWSVGGVLQDLGVRTIEFAVAEDVMLKAYYQHERRVVPDRPREGGGDLD